MADAVLNLIDLDQRRTGYRKFLCCYVFQGDFGTFVIDPGPSSTIPHLVSALREIGMDKVGYVLLTHIHLDHGGGTAELLKSFPNAKVFCHESGVKHLIEPSKLWKGSLKVLGDVADMYGEPDPVTQKCMIGAEDLEKVGVKVVPTPGHAAHHVSFVIGDVLFAGEAVGTRFELASGFPYLRQATPPKFVLDEALSSIDRLLALEEEPKWLAFAHYGVVGDAFSWCRRARKQLVVWVETLRELGAESRDDLEQRFFNRLMEIDPLYGRGRFDELPDDIKVRERHFLGNAMDGMLEYLESNPR